MNREWVKIKQGYTSNLESRDVGSRTKAEKMISRTKKLKIPVKENEFCSMMHKGLPKESFRIIGDIVIVKDVSEDEIRREAEKPLYITRYE